MLKIVLLILGILAVVVLGILATAWLANRSFNQKVAQEVAALFQKTDAKKDGIRQTDLARLPPCVQKWLENSGVIGKARISTVRLKQQGMMRTKPARAWMPFTAVQYFTVAPPAFNWQVNVQAAPLLSLAGRDQYANGRGHMLIKLLALFPVADAKGPETDQGSMVRYLAETIWFPTAALSDYLTWEALDAASARVTMSYGGVTAAGVFRFNAQGDVISFEAQRYGEFDGTYSLETWFITMTGWKTLQGIRIPYASEVAWKSKAGDFTWLKLEITELEFDMPMTY